jgi:hypothetical protein
MPAAEGSSEAAELSSEVGCYFWISKASAREMLPLAFKATTLAVKFHFPEIEAKTRTG